MNKNSKPVLKDLSKYILKHFNPGYELIIKNSMVEIAITYKDDNTMEILLNNAFLEHDNPQLVTVNLIDKEYKVSIDESFDFVNYGASLNAIKECVEGYIKDEYM